MEGLARTGEFSDVSFSVHSGEIVGIAGLVGSGRSEIVETIFGARKADAGRVTVDGKAAPARLGRRRRSGPAWGWRRRSARARALLLGEPVYRNVSAVQPGPLRPRRLHRPAARELAEAARVDRAAGRCGPATRRRVIRTLSGGNQQKVVVGEVAAARHAGC